MRKKIMAVVLSCLTIIGLVVSASAVSVDEMTKAAVQIISRSEGTYGTINRNDNGAVSIGMLQWHADRALQLMRSIANADTGSAQSILGSTFYNEVMTASSWNSRTFSAAEGTAASNLLTTAAGKSKQDALAYSDVQGYISAGQNLGISRASDSRRDSPSSLNPADHVPLYLSRQMDAATPAGRVRPSQSC